MEERLLKTCRTFAGFALFTSMQVEGQQSQSITLVSQQICYHTLDYEGEKIVNCEVLQQICNSSCLFLNLCIFPPESAGQLLQLREALFLPNPDICMDRAMS